MITWSLSLCREQCWLELTITTDMSCCLKNDNTVSAWSFLTDRTSSDLISGCSRTQSSVRYYSVGWINRTFDTFPLGAALFAIQTNTRLNGCKWAKTRWGGWDRRCACVSLGPPGPSSQSETPHSHQVWVGDGCVSASHPVGSGTVAPVAPEQDQQLVLSGAAASIGGEAQCLQPAGWSGSAPSLTPTLLRSG